MADPRLEKSQDGRFLLHGDLSWRSVPDLWQQTQSMLETTTGNGIEIDLQGVGRVDSSGIALLIEWFRLAKNSKKSILFTHVPAQMRAIAKVCDLDDILPIQA